MDFASRNCTIDLQSTNSGANIAMMAQPDFMKKLFSQLVPGGKILTWIAVQTQRESVKTQERTRPTVPRPEGSGTYAGAEGPPTGADNPRSHITEPRTTTTWTVKRIFVGVSWYQTKVVGVIIGMFPE